MASFNKVILMGNLTRDPQLRYLPSNMAVCDFGLAVNRRWRDKDGNQKEEVCFVDLTAWGRQAETINQYMSKGRGILIEGHLRLETWTGQDGQKRSKHSVFVEGFQFVGGRGDAPAGAGAAGAGSAGFERPAPAGPAAEPPPARAYSPSEAPAPEPTSNFEPEPGPPTGDNIPF